MASTHYASLLRGPRVFAAFDDEPARACDDRAADSIATCRRSEPVDGARAIVIRPAPHQELGDHQVGELAWLTVVEGGTRIEAGGDVVEARTGTLLTFEPGERHSVASERGRPDHPDPLALARRGHYPNVQEAASK
jgi:quercetin dioxygenase-like cupin family protein